MEKIKKFIQKRGIILVLILAAFFILFNLTRGGMFGDDAMYSLRSIGLVDFMFADKQPTLYQLFEEFPWWGSLSNHDHPPLIFWIMHFFLIFGQSILIARLPFVIFGLLSVFLIYLLFKENINKKIAVLGSLLLVVNSYFIWFSKITYLEGGIVFFLLLTLYLFIKFLSSLRANEMSEAISSGSLRRFALRDDRAWFYFGLSLGLLLLTKYTTLFILPALFFYLLIRERKVFKRKELYLSGLIVLAVISPVLTYNIMMYKTLGHFDLQWAGVLGQDSPWSLDRDITTNYWTNFVGILKILGNSTSFVYVGVFVLSVVYFILKKGRDIIKRKKIKINNYNRVISISLYTLFFLFLFFMGIVTPEFRFLNVFSPLMAIVMALAICSIMSSLKGSKKRAFGFIVFVFIGFQLFFVFNTHILNKPVGRENILYAKNRNIDYGIYALDKYLNSLLEDKNVVNRMDFYKELKRRDERLSKYKLENSFTYSSGEKFFPIFIYDPNLKWFSNIWLFERRRLYDNLPFFSVNEFISLVEDRGGVGSFYFIKATENAMLTKEKYRIEFSDKFEKQLIDEEAEVEEIRRKDGEVAFKIYRR